MIHVVDMPMGSGKTSAAITYMNEHPETPFIYITPFLDETERVVNACSELKFISPSEKIPQYQHRKRNHLRALVNQRRNISMTHALFLRIDDATAKAIAERGYVVIIDEVIEVFQQMRESVQDVEMLIKCGYLERRGGDDTCEYFHPSAEADTYHGAFDSLFERSQYGQIVKTSGWNDGKKVKYGFWEVNRNLFTLSEQIFILTYMFDGMPMKGFIESNGIAYDYIGTRKFEDGQYRFCDVGETPAIFEHISRMVHVCNSERINAIGSDKYALSSAWTKRGAEDGNAAMLGSHISSYFRRHSPDGVGSPLWMWTTYKTIEDDVKSRKPGGIFLPFNSKAVNCYGDRVMLAYCVNIFADPGMMRYLKHIGVAFDEDKYALAQMVQWVWRSRIRNNQEIWIYIPSKRMRELFVRWMKDVEATYKAERKKRMSDGQNQPAR